MKIRAVLFLLLFISLFYAIEVIEPTKQDIQDGDTIYLGEIGPGQTIALQFIPTVTEGGKYGEGGEYDLAVPHDLPLQWEGKTSKLYENPAQVLIKAPPDVAEGEYLAKITLEDTNDDQLENITFTVRIRINHDILDVSVSPTSVSVGPGQPARYDITITNKGTASDVFDVSSSGLKRWQFKRSVYVPPKSTRTISYELVENEEETYESTLTVVSQSSPVIKKEQTVTFQVNSDLLSDYKATNRGVIIFPIFESLVYSFMGLISNLF